MKLGTLKNAKKRDGDLIVVSKDNSKYALATHIAPNLREAVEEWSTCEPLLRKLSHDLNTGSANVAESLLVENLHSPLPRTFQWADGSAFIQHIKLVRKARNAPLPETLQTVPLIYQGGGDDFLAPLDPIPLIDEAHGLDFESEVTVVTDFVPMGIKPEAAIEKIRLVMICNDVSLRGLIPEELAQGFGFFQSKPSSAFAPFAVTVDELGTSWKNGRLYRDLRTTLNGTLFGNPNAGEMHFSFGDIIAHAARTRNLGPGTIIGSGTVSNEDRSRGSSCLVERRMLEQIDHQKITTPFMKDGDHVEIEMLDDKGSSIFGKISQRVKKV